MATIGPAGLTPQPTNIRTPKLVVTSLLDGTDPNLEPLAARIPDDFQRASQQAEGDLAVSAALYRAGVPRTKKNLKHHLSSAISFGWNLAAAVAIGLGATGCAFAAGQYLDGLTQNQLKTYESEAEVESRWAHQRLAIDDWKGKQTFQIQGNNTSASPVNSRCLRPEPQEFTRILLENHERWPSAVSVVHTFGHGFGIQGLCSQETETFAQALQTAADQSQKKVDVVLMESCMMGNLESLLALSRSSKFAIASEQTLNFVVPQHQPETRLLRPEHYAQLAQNPQGAEQVSQAIFQQSVGQSQQQQTQARFDLEKLSQVFEPRLDQLAQKLTSELERDAQPVLEQIGKCLDKAALVNSQSGFRDLQGFLEGLSSADSSLSEEVQASARAALDGMAEAMPEVRLSQSAKDANLHGLSFVDPRLKFTNIQSGETVHYDQGMSANWRSFSQRLQEALEASNKEAASKESAS